LKRAVNVISDWFIELKTNPDSNLCKKWMKTIQSEFYNKNPLEIRTKKFSKHLF
jgi:hypothetical protein